MRLLITGATGYLGSRLVLQAGKDIQVLAGCRRPEAVAVGQTVPMDLNDPKALEYSLRHLSLDSSDAIIHTAAINPGGDESQMPLINIEGSRAVAALASRSGARLVHVSTDVVHDGRRAPYGDEDTVSPLNAYAASKAAAEQAVLDALPTATVVRTSLIYGLRRMDRGTEGFAQRLQRGEPVRLFHDVIRQPIWVESLAAALIRLTRLNVSGRLNVAGRQALSREQFGRKMLDYWQVAGRHRVESVAAVDVSDKIPLDLRLDLTKAESLGLPIPGVDEVLRDAGAN